MENLQQKILDFVRLNLPKSGILRKNSKGMVFLDITDRYIHDLFPLLDDQQLRPPPYFSFEQSVGAHISIILASEARAHKLHDFTIQEEAISFEVCQLVVCEPKSWQEVEKVYFLQIKSEKFLQIRHMAGLSSYRQEYPFHITIAIKERFGSLERSMLSLQKGKLDQERWGLKLKF